MAQERSNNSLAKPSANQGVARVTSRTITTRNRRPNPINKTAEQGNGRQVSEKQDGYA
jgi:hypothetical protein